MDKVLDIQRDHVALIHKTRRLLAPDGELFFSTNLRTFKIDPSLIADPNCTDITARTLPPDFRDRHVHHAFLIGGSRER
jgi:23S rRNA G2069 N7-methylase RlmK/C1962 C5-methylase RlmI